MKHLMQVLEGGYPFDDVSIDYFQQMFNDRDGFIASIVGDNTILSGVELNVNTGQVSQGLIVVNGKLYHLVSGQNHAKISKQSQVTQRQFKDGSLKDAYTNDFYEFGEAGTDVINFSELQRVDSLKLITAILERKPTEQQRGLARPATAQEVIDGNKNDVFLSPKNFPQNVLKKLYSGTKNIGNIPATDHNVTVSFPNVGTANYVVIGNLVSNASDPFPDNDINFVYYAKTASSFGLSFREISGGQKNVRFDYVIVAM